MPYREYQRNVARCVRHGADDACAACLRCGRPICVICTNETERGAYCDRCHLVHRIRARLRTSLWAGLLAGAALTTVLVIVLAILAPPHGWVAEIRTRHYLRAVEKEPCDAGAVRGLVKQLALHSEMSATWETFERLQHFFNHCSPDVELGLQYIRLLDQYLETEGEAVSVARQLVWRWPQRRDLQHALAASLLKNGETEQAEDLYHVLLESDRNDREAASALASIDAIRHLGGE